MYHASTCCRCLEDSLGLVDPKPMLKKLFKDQNIIYILQNEWNLICEYPSNNDRNSLRRKFVYTAWRRENPRLTKDIKHYNHCSRKRIPVVKSFDKNNVTSSLNSPRAFLKRFVDLQISRPKQIKDEVCI